MADAFESERYEALAVVGTGGMGTVHRCLDRETGKTVAIKLHGRQRPSDIERFERECRLLAEIDHPAVVGYLDHGQTADGRLYLVEEWIDGVSLDQHHRDHGFDLVETITLVGRVGEALAAIHARGILHRDVKPSNILIPHGELAATVLIDFGLARHVAVPGPTRSGMLVGTPGFLSPEQARGQRALAPATDVFSLGCVLYQLLTSGPPFESSDIRAAAVKVIFEEPPPVELSRPDVPPEVVALCRQMLRKLPDARLADGAAVVAAIAGLPPLTAGRRIKLHELAERPTVTEGAWDSDIPAGHTVAMVIAVGPEGAIADEPTTDDATVAALVAPFAVRLERLLDGSMLALAIDRDAATAATRAAECALALRSQVEGDIVVVTGERELVGQVVDWAARALRADEVRGLFGAGASADAGAIRVDEGTADLVGQRFELRRDRHGWLLAGSRS